MSEPAAPPPTPIESWEVLDLLTSLVQKSLAVYEEDEQGQGRYRLLEPTRQYARDRLLEMGEVETVRNRHRGFFLRLAGEAEVAASPVRTEWFDRLEAEHDNLLAALEWSQAREPEVALRFAADLVPFWVTRSYFSEARRWLERTLALGQPAAPTREWCDVLIWAGRMGSIQGDLRTARTRLDEGLEVCRSLGYTRGVIRALAFLTWVVEREGDLTQARALLEESVALDRASDDRDCMALGALAHVALRQGDLQAAQSLAVESLALARESQSEWYIGWQLLGLGKVVEAQGEWKGARDLYEQSLAALRKAKTKSGVAHALLRLGQLLDRHGDGPAAGSLLAESLAIMSELGNKAGIAESLDEFARRAMAQGSAERAARLFGAAEGLRAAIGAPLLLPDRAEHDRSVAAVRTALGEEAFAAARAEGRAMPIEQAIAEALEEPRAAAGS